MTAEELKKYTRWLAGWAVFVYLAGVLLSQTPLNRDDAGQDVPVFLLGGHDEWFVSKFGMSYEDTATHALNHRNDALARAFESVTLGRDKRSSINNIGEKARDIAQAIRRKATELDAA